MIYPRLVKLFTICYYLSITHAFKHGDHLTKMKLWWPYKRQKNQIPCMTDQVVDLLERESHAHEHSFAWVVAGPNRAFVVLEQLVDESVLGRCRVHWNCIEKTKFKMKCLIIYACIERNFHASWMSGMRWCSSRVGWAESRI